MAHQNRYLLAYDGKLLGNQDGVYLCAEKELSNISYEALLNVGNFSGLDYTVAILDEEPSDSVDLDMGVGLRALLSLVDSEEEYCMLSTAAQVAWWYRAFKFCPRCSTELSLHESERAKVCSSCGHHQYPRISPCIIVLVRRGDQCLLAHAAKYAQGRFSTLAGFIEAGESAEQAVHREIMEEVGIEVKNVRYCFSQSWPFPHSFMFGFMADYKSGDITPDGVEILDADWFSADNLPVLPPRFTIARRLINQFLEDIGAEIEPDSALFFPAE